MNELAEKLMGGMIRENAELDFKIQADTELYRKGFGWIELYDSEGNPFRGNAEIHLSQKTHEYKFGANLFMLDSFPETEKNQRFREIFPDLFNLAVVPFYWDGVEPEPGILRFSKDSPWIYRRPQGDLCVEYCAEKGLTPKGHPLCWNQALPKWLPRDKREFVRLLEKRMAEIAERYADKILIYDAINEVLSANCDPNSPYPDGIMETAFRMAETYFPNAQLILNEDRHWWKYQGEHTHFFMLAKELIAHGHRPGGLGFQYHFFPYYFQEEYKHFLDAENLYRLLDLYGSLNIPCNLSEISIMSRLDLLGAADADEFQSIVTERLYRLWFSHPATDAIIWWNPIDGTAAGGKLGDLEGENSFRAGLYNYDLSLKKAGQTVRNLIRNEWTTKNVQLNWTPGGDNRFRGFYGTYDVEVRTDSGVIHAEADLSKFTPKANKIRLPFSSRKAE